MEAAGPGTVDVSTNVPKIDAPACSGCGRCVAACLKRIISLETEGFHKNAVIVFPERCTGCRHCVGACPISAMM